MTFKIKLYWEMSDAGLEELYEIGRAEGVLDHVLYDVRADKNLFLIFARKAEVFGAVYAPGGAFRPRGAEERSPGRPKDGRPLGFFYLDSFEGSTARLHFCLFRAGRNERLAVGRQVLDWCFETFEFKSLVGVVPALNPGAVGYARAMGGRCLGLIPGACWIERLRRTVAGVQFVFKPAAPAGSARAGVN